MDGTNCIDNNNTTAIANLVEVEDEVGCNPIPMAEAPEGRTTMSE